MPDKGDIRGKGPKEEKKYHKGWGGRESVNREDHTGTTSPREVTEGQSAQDGNVGTNVTRLKETPVMPHQ